MSEHIPAWKRVGLKVKQVLSNDPLGLSTHLESANVTSKQNKEIKRRKAEEPATSKKPAKRPKLPKDKRPPPPEKDQLVYLRQYHEDRENWKFSKQKQNWIIKNIKHIPDQYSDSLSAYLCGLQGGSRERLVNELKDAVDRWNVASEEAERKLEEQLQESKEGEDEEDKDHQDVEEEKKEDAKEVPDFNYVIKAKNLVKELTGEVLAVKGEISNASDEAEKEEETTVAHEGKVEEQKEQADENNVDEKKYKNLLIDKVNVREYLDDDDFKDPESEQENNENAEEPSEKKDKKEKKEKKKKKDKKKKAKK